MIRAGMLLALTGLLGMALAGWGVLPGRAVPGATPAALVLGETPGAVPVSLLIRNNGIEDDWLLGGSTSLAQGVEVHHSRLADGVRRMLAAPDGLPVPASATVILEPESRHLMLIGLREPLVQGQTFPLTLRFAHAGDVTVTARVRRKVDAAGITPIPPVVAGTLTISLVSAPPAPADIVTTPVASGDSAGLAGIRLMTLTALLHNCVVSSQGSRIWQLRCGPDETCWSHG